MAIVLDLLIYFGDQHWDSLTVASSIGLTAFGLMLVVAAYESRGISSTALMNATFDNRQINWTALAGTADGAGRSLLTRAASRPSGVYPDGVRTLPTRHKAPFRVRAGGRPAPMLARIGGHAVEISFPGYVLGEASPDSCWRATSTSESIPADGRGSTLGSSTWTTP